MRSVVRRSAVAGSCIRHRAAIVQEVDGYLAAAGTVDAPGRLVAS